MGLAAVPLDTEPVLAHCREMGAARDEDHVRPGLGERGAIGSANAAGADHRDPHPILLNRAGWGRGGPILPDGSTDFTRGSFALDQLQCFAAPGLRPSRPAVTEGVG